jgi:predicted dehydrogenase
MRAEDVSPALPADKQPRTLRRIKKHPVSRRSFLKTSATVAALSLARPGAAGPNDRIRTAVIGCRNRGPQVATACLKSGQFEIATLCDCDSIMFDIAMKNLEDLLKKKPKFEKDFRRVLEDKDIDAVIVATPDHWHAAMTVLALDAGKHVYVEKPASYNVQDGKEMVAAQDKHANLAVLVGSQQRSGKHFAEARDFIKSGALGKIAFCRAWITHRRALVPVVPDSTPPASLDYDLWLGPAPLRPYNENRVHYNWRFFRDYGTGEMGNWAAHWLDIVRWCLDLDYPKSVTGYGGTYVDHDAKEWPDTQTVLYEYPDLTVLWELRLWTNFELQGADAGAEFDGDKGSVVISRNGWRFYPPDGRFQDHASSETEVRHATNFAEAIRGAAKPVAPMLEGHKTSVLCHMGNIAVTANRRLEFDAATQTFANDAEANTHLARTYRTPWSLPG